MIKSHTPVTWSRWQPEFVTIRSSLTQGAGVVVFKIMDEKLVLMAASEFIGTPNRWLNIAAIADLDNNSTVEIAWVQTPHIGGILRVANVVNDQVQIIGQKSGYSNHKIGQRNLCLSAVTTTALGKTLYLPISDYTAVVGLQLTAGKLAETSRLSQVTDPARTLSQQVSLGPVLTDGACIYKL